MAKKKQKPDSIKKIQLSYEESEALKDRVRQSNLDVKDIEILLGSLSLTASLQRELSNANSSIRHLRKLFGFISESNKNKSTSQPNDNATTESTENNNENNSGESPEEFTQPAPNKSRLNNQSLTAWDPSKNHGRTGSDKYIGCPIIKVPFNDDRLLDGKCPECAACDTDASLSHIKPQVFVFLEGKPLISGERYSLQRARCKVCAQYFTAPQPDEIKERPKYEPSCYSSLAINHYYGGLPFKRLETLQAAQGVPLSDSTQYDMMNKFYQNVIQAIYGELIICFADGSSHYYDDTTGRIIEQMVANKRAMNKGDRKSIHSTALLSDYHGKRIYVFSTNTQTAGKVFKSIIEKRTTDTVFWTMSDASPHNFPDIGETLCARWIITLCLSHGRRRFFELLDEAEPNEDIQLVIDCISKVYRHERHCKQHPLTDDERLQYHQQHSEPVMKALYSWFNNLLRYEQISTNSRFGEAITYMLKRWTWLTQFLRVPGAALDNNICELAIKVAIRYRKNSLFYKTFYGAEIGDAMMSVIYTAERCGANIFDYLNTVQIHAEEVKANPGEWLPWCYEETLTKMSAPNQAAEIANAVGA